METIDSMTGEPKRVYVTLLVSGASIGMPRDDVEIISGDIVTISEQSGSPKVEVTRISLTQAAMIVIVAMKKEKDWDVLRLILERVPQVLQNKALILSRDGNDIDYFAAALCSL
ncbi:hypothetical protein SK128_006155, partial [Halocaridina rubra]